MIRRPIQDDVMGLASRLADECHPQVAQKHAEELARYARLTSACDALLQSRFVGLGLLDNGMISLRVNQRVERAIALKVLNP